MGILIYPFPIPYLANIPATPKKEAAPCVGRDTYSPRTSKINDMSSGKTSLQNVTKSNKKINHLIITRGFVTIHT
jgi:hypothetical protein